MLNLAEYKRRQAAPGVKVTLKNFGRDRRYPIINRFNDPGTANPAARPHARQGRADGDGDRPRPARRISDQSFRLPRTAALQCGDCWRRLATTTGRAVRPTRTTRLARVGCSSALARRPLPWLRSPLRRRLAPPPLAGRLRRLRQRFGVLVGHDDVAALQRRGVVGVLERIGPALARPAARTAGDELPCDSDRRSAARYRAGRWSTPPGPCLSPGLR